ncbi:hypothetical protein GXN76_01485 [Kroppenstedtia pulmonis]|uniref:4-vinyl reductase n=1 Tax=Kroppenstedtia pulmonis TaxID=1380685 RepID=A0A7D3XH29_9BACL|nr:hypothetical protein [Kroppenstedtia pulmonis]QKG83264.1 hypothetical protein GXN76_01485 [Kroppenstedtia pulmonis]
MSDEKIYRFWWLHDGAWYQNVARRIGFEAANDLNKECLRYMAIRGTRSYVRENKIDTSQIQDIETLVYHFMKAPKQLWPEEWIQMEATITGPDTFDVRLHRNFAVEWVKKAGTLDSYECPGLVLREGYFEGLNVRTYEQGERTCMCRGDDECVFWARVEFPKHQDDSHE